MEHIDKIKNIIEALLIVSEGGLTREEILEAITDSDKNDIEEGLRLLKDEYGGDGRAFNIAEIAGRCRIVTKPEYMPWIGNLYKKEAQRLSGPSFETLAIIAYKQPVTRAEVEIIRGVSVGGVIQTLLDKGLVEVRGRKDVIGRPLLYGTTKRFLEVFGLNSLQDLPLLKDFGEADLEYGKPQEVVENENAAETAEDTDELSAVDSGQSAQEKESGDEPEKAE